LAKTAETASSRPDVPQSVEEDLFHLRQPSLYTFGEMQVYDKFSAAFERIEITECQS
jgi:hypothetical protein